ncbi:hypothetical protein EPN42_13125 [bacterium]|nr:MAG: hypothetical protein EPN42_13125 [bacterium]
MIRFPRIPSHIRQTFVATVGTFGALALAALPALAVQTNGVGGVDSTTFTTPITGITTGLVLPVVGVLGGLMAGVGTIGHFAQPEHKGAMDKMAGIGGIAVLGSIVAAKLPAMVTSLSGALIH